MTNAKDQAIELNAQTELVVNHRNYSDIAGVGDTEIMCHECQSSVSVIIPQVKAMQLLVENFTKVWTNKGWITEDGDIMPVYGEGNQAIYKYFWDESYQFVKDAGYTQDYQSMCKEIKENATTSANPTGYLIKPEWMLAFKKLQARNKEIFMTMVKDRTNNRMSDANDYMTENFFGPLMLIKALWASRSKEIVAAKDADGTLFCPICGSYEVKPIGQSIPRGRVATADDGYDKMWGFNQEQRQVKEVKYFFTDDESGISMNIIDNMEGEAWEDVEAASQEHIDEYNEAVEEDIARAKFYEIAPFMGIGQACKKIGKLHANLIADEISDYYMAKM